LGYRVIKDEQLCGWPLAGGASQVTASGRKKVVVTGCFDWLHSGHVRFFEEVSSLGDLYVCIGHDVNVRLLKGEGHPFFSEEERRYMVQSVCTVRQALITTGQGWMDAEPEIESLRPDIYAVNEDGDREEKRAFCRERGIEYVVLTRTPKPGLPRRESSVLRGF
jgi:cytidyltransferase-like protein